MSIWLFVGISISLIVLLYLYLKIKYGFWFYQPVFHKYNLSYYFSYPGIIKKELPEPNRYTNFINISTYTYDTIHWTKMASFIKSNYSNRSFKPSLENIKPYFSERSYFSLYYKKTKLVERKTDDIIEDFRLLGCITSRLLHVIINGSSPDAIFDAYYVDYLCVDEAYRKGGIAAQLIQTHEYNQRHLDKEVSVSLFKREEDVLGFGVVPLCIYSVFHFDCEPWSKSKPDDLHAKYNIIQIGKGNMNVLMEYMKEVSSKFGIVIQPHLGTLTELMKTNNIYIYVIMVANEVLCAYFFRKTCIENARGKHVISLFSSINNTTRDIFTHGFKVCFWRIMRGFGELSIENIADNNIIIRNIREKSRPRAITTNAYYFYNFAYSTFRPERVFIIV